MASKSERVSLCPEIKPHSRPRKTAQQAGRREKMNTKFALSATFSTREPTRAVAQHEARQPTPDYLPDGFLASRREGERVKRNLLARRGPIEAPGGIQVQSRSLATQPYGLAIRWQCQRRSLDTRSADSFGHAAAAAASFSIHGDRRAQTLRLRKAAVAAQHHQPGSSRCALSPHATRHHPDRLICPLSRNVSTR